MKICCAIRGEKSRVKTKGNSSSISSGVEMERLTIISSTKRSERLIDEGSSFWRMDVSANGCVASRVLRVGRNARNKMDAGWKCRLIMKHESRAAAATPCLLQMQMKRVGQHAVPYE